MKKIILIPDSFKGTMSSSEICEIMERTINKYFDCEVIKIPVADGGEGTVDAFITAVGGIKKYVDVTGPFGDKVKAYYGILRDNQTAVIEMSACAGLPMAGEKSNPMITTTYGVGELINYAIKDGCKEIIIGLGGSCTNDAGTGCASALGAEFTDENGNQFIPVGGTLININKINIDVLKRNIQGVKFTVMCDIDNPLYGENGAAYIFAPQKGASGTEVLLLDEGLQHISRSIKNIFNIDISSLAGGGAAGGMGAGLAVFLGAELQMGIDIVLKAVNFMQLIKDAGLIISGEGRIDSQSTHGKVVYGVAKLAKVKNIPLLAVVGDIEDDIDKMYSDGVTAIFSINRKAIPFEKAKLRSKKDLEITMNDICRLIYKFTY